MHRKYVHLPYTICLLLEFVYSDREMKRRKEECSCSAYLHCTRNAYPFGSGEQFIFELLLEKSTVLNKNEQNTTPIHKLNNCLQVMA